MPECLEQVSTAIGLAPPTVLGRRRRAEHGRGRQRPHRVTVISLTRTPSGRAARRPRRRDRRARERSGCPEARVAAPPGRRADLGGKGTPRAPAAVVPRRLDRAGRPGGPGRVAAADRPWAVGATGPAPLR